jgi:hypothetical protein
MAKVLVFVEEKWSFAHVRCVGGSTSIPDPREGSVVYAPFFRNLRESIFCLPDLAAFLFAT